MIWRILKFLRSRKIDKSLRNPLKSQEYIFKKILHQTLGCKIASDFKLDTVKNINEFQKRMPITDYSFYQDYISDILNGKENILFPGRPIAIALSGGTTSASKFLPLSKNLIKSYRQFNLDMAFCYMNDSGNDDIFSDKIFLVVSSPENIPGIHLPVGRPTGVMAQIAPKLLRERYVPNMKVILNESVEDKIRLTTQQSFENRKHIFMAAGLTPYLMSAFENIISYAKKEDYSYSKIHDIFPNLRVAFHGGTTFNFYTQKIQELTGPLVDHRNVYSAAEGPIAFQFSGSSPGLLPVFDGVFFEFIPVKQINSDQPDVLLLNDIKCNEPYYILLTTQGGLFRYKIGDIVEFISKEPPLLIVIGRDSDQIDLTSEQLRLVEATEALQKTADSLGIKVTNFIVSPSNFDEVVKPVSHEWIIECEKTQSNTDIFQDILDKNLCDLNHRYEQLRTNDSLLGRPIIKFVSNGTFMRYMEKELVYGQQKMKQMHNDRKCAEDLLAYA